MKHIYYTLFFCLLPLLGMAQGYSLETDVDVPSSLLPSGYTVPTVTITGTDRQEGNLSSDIDVSDNAHASVAATGLTQVVSALETYVLDSILVQELGLDTTNFQIDMIIQVKGWSRINPEISSAPGDIFLAGDEKYRIRYHLKWKATEP